MRIVRRAALVLGSLLLVFLLFVGFLLVTNPDPRDAEGWTRHADLPAARGEVASAVAGGRLYVIGGLAGGFARTADRVDILDAAADSWSEGPPLPEKRHHAAAAAIGGTVYVTGGSLTATNWEPLPEGWRLSAGADAWQPIAPMPQGRMGHDLVEVGGRLYAIGGRGGEAVLIYDPGADRWSSGAPVPEARDHLRAVVADDLVYAIGGRDDQITARVDVYDPEGDSWSEEPPDLPQAMSAMAVGLTGDGLIHVVGGEDPGTFGGGVIDAHYAWLPGSDGWEEAPLPILATHGSAYGVIGGRLFVAGGARRQGAFSSVSWTGLTQSFGL